MIPYKAMAHIHSLNGEIKEVTVLENDGGNKYVVEYNGVLGFANSNFIV